MAQNYDLDGKITLDLECIISVAATDGGIRLIYIDGKQEIIAPLSTRDRDRFFDTWLGCAPDQTTTAQQDEALARKTGT